MREVDADYGDDLPDLSYGAAGDGGADFWARAVGFDATAQAFWRGWRGVAGGTNGCDDRAGRGDGWVLFSFDAVAESACDRARCGSGQREALERIEATHLAEQLVGEMSAGEKRRILIARALVHRPKQLLLDEPSNALDLAAQRELRETLRRLAQEGTGLVLVTHHLGDILPEIERVILMREGRIVGDGPRTELLTEVRLSELFSAPVRIGRDEEWLHSW